MTRFSRYILIAFGILLVVSRSHASEPVSLPETVCAAKRIVFLGDSITYQGDYVVEAGTFLTNQPCTKTPPLVINVGLPSETVSGLSESGHAGGKFPRPNLFERLERVLDSTEPDFVFACYGMNCGIYQPLEPQRFEAYQNGIHRLRETLKQREIPLVLVTPPVFDGQVAINKTNFSYPKYDEVLAAYARWLVTLRDEGQWVIDLHSDFTEALKTRRTEDPQFTFQKDAVHPNREGHREIAKSIIGWLHEQGMQPVEMDMSRWKANSECMRLLRDAYLSDAGHLRPGVKPGFPVDEALQRHSDLRSSEK